MLLEDHIRDGDDKILPENEDNSEKSPKIWKVGVHITLYIKLSTTENVSV